MANLDYASLRLLFIAVLAASLLYSIGIIILGIWILTDASLMSYWLNKIVITDYGALTVALRMTSYMPIGLGLVAILSFGIGLSHVLRGGKLLLIIYMVVTSAATLLEIILALVPMGMWSQVTSELPRYLQTTLKNEYRGISQGAAYPNSIVWDAMQIELECCGYNGPTDYTKDYQTYAYYWHNNYRYYQADSVSYSGMSYMFPVSCCKFADKSIVTKLDFANYENYVSNKKCPVEGVDYYSNSCQQSLEDYVYVYFAVILATSVVMLILHIVSLVICAYLLKKRMVPEAAYSSMSLRLSTISLKRSSSGKVSPASFRIRHSPSPYKGRGTSRW